MNTEYLKIISVLPSTNIARDILWYEEKTGFKKYFFDTIYVAYGLAQALVVIL